MADRRSAREWRWALAGALMGGLFFAWIAGARTLDPTEVGWAMKLDWRIHFLGWHLFRGEPWHWPPGLLESYQHAPSGTTIGFTDSIPLMAFVFKPFHGVLPMPFQYLSLWMLVSYALQGVFGVLLARCWTTRPILQLLAAALFVLMPTLLGRVGHAALCAHWLILWALWLYVRSTPAQPVRVGEHAALGLLAGLIHPYLAVMTAAVLAAVALRTLLEARLNAHAVARAIAGVTALAAAGVAMLSGWWMSGLFTVSGAGDLASEGLDYFSMNLLGPITPTGWSILLPEWPLGSGGQTFEGFQYLGAGALALLVVAGLLLVIRPQALRWTIVAPILLVTLVCAVYSLSPKVTLGSAVLVNYGSPALERLAVFRATGRFFWPFGYLMLAAAIAVVVTRLPRRTATIALGAAVVLQLVDLSGVHAERRATSRDPAFHTWDMPLVSPAWHAALRHYDHLVVLPPYFCGPPPIGFEAPAYLAGLHGLTINDGQVARHNAAGRRAYCAEMTRATRAGEVDDRSFYLVTPAYRDLLERTAREPITCGAIDGVHVCVTEDSYAAWRHEAALE